MTTYDWSNRRGAAGGGAATLRRILKRTGTRLLVPVLIGLAVSLPTDASAETRDSAQGTGRDVNGNPFDFQATSGPSGADTAGSMTVVIGYDIITVPVMCLRVVGNQAMMASNFTDKSGNPQRVVFVVAEDNGPTGDRFRVLGGSDRVVRQDDCNLPFMNLAPIQSGQVSVIDSDFDADSDGVPDISDNCPSVSNAQQEDSDGDGRGDACDPDDDADGVADTLDNCPAVSNPDQFDVDGDGIGNACDPLDGRPADELLGALDADVHALNLDRGTATSLLVKLQGAARSLADGDSAQACAKLGAFINEITALSDKKIAATTADELIVDARVIMSRVPCDQT
jgi:hypothetical protein